MNKDKLITHVFLTHGHENKAEDHCGGLKEMLDWTFSNYESGKTPKIFLG